MARNNRPELFGYFKNRTERARQRELRRRLKRLKKQGNYGEAIAEDG